MDKKLIAPCGMDCAHCRAYLAYKYDKDERKCPGCRIKDKKCAFIIKRCEFLSQKKINFCYECPDFPCEQLKKIEARYAKKGWPNSFIGNNQRIKEIGLDNFSEEQDKRFTCPKCGGEICIHNGKCIKCGDRA